MCSLQYRPYMDHFQNTQDWGGRRPKAAAPHLFYSYHGPYMACTVGCTWLTYSLCAALYGLYSGYIYGHLWPYMAMYVYIYIYIYTLFYMSVYLFIVFDTAHLREFVLTTVILLPGVGNQGLFWGGWPRFRGIRGIRWRVPGASKNVVKTIKIGLWAGKMDDIFGGGLVIYPTRAHFRSSGLVYEPTNHTCWFFLYGFRSGRSYSR